MNWKSRCHWPRFVSTWVQGRSWFISGFEWNFPLNLCPLPLADRWGSVGVGSRRDATFACGPKLTARDWFGLAPFRRNKPKQKQKILRTTADSPKGHLGQTQDGTTRVRRRRLKFNCLSRRSAQPPPCGCDVSESVPSPRGRWISSKSKDFLLIGGPTKEGNERKRPSMNQLPL